MLQPWTGRLGLEKRRSPVLIGPLGAGDRWRTGAAVAKRNNGVIAMTNFIEQLTAILILIDFLFGVAFGVIGGAILGSRREDYDKSLLGAATDSLSAGARVIHGVFTRDDGYLRSLLPGSIEPDSGDTADEGAGSYGQGSER